MTFEAELHGGFGFTVKIVILTCVVIKKSGVCTDWDNNHFLDNKTLSIVPLVSAP